MLRRSMGEEFAVATTKGGRKKFLGRASPDLDGSAHRPGKIFDISEIYDLGFD